MATIIFNFISSLLSCSFIFLCCFLANNHALKGKEPLKNHNNSQAYIVRVSSLVLKFEASECKRSSKGLKEGAALEVSQNFGSYFQAHRDDTNAPTLTHQLFIRDQCRVNLIHSRRKQKLVSNSSRVTLPVNSGLLSMGIVEYVVTVALGTPEKKVTFVMDTGSDFSWIQCLPCQWSCYEQMEPIFNPSKSSSYTNISCNSSLCKLSDDFGCYQETSTCSYSISYGDGSRTVGFVSEDKLTLTNSNVISKFLFGCGQNNTGILLGTAGILGLGLSKTSVMSQITPKYEKAFSYCLPSSLCFTGHLTLGNDSLIGRNTSSIQFTPLFYSNDLPYYFADLIAMSVGGKKLPVDESVFTRPGTIIDSGTVLSRIPPTAYVALQSAFQYQMAKYPRTCQIEGLDPCYDLSNNTYVMIPKISLFFRGNVELDIDASGTLLGFNESCICLAFMGNTDPTYVSIIGNFQLKTYDVIHDIEGKKVGFGRGGCL